MNTKPKWPTLEGRLSSSLSDEKTALIQLEKTLPLTELGKKKLRKYVTKQTRKTI